MEHKRSKLTVITKAKELRSDVMPITQRSPNTLCIRYKQVQPKKLYYKRKTILSRRVQ